MLTSDPLGSDWNVDVEKFFHCQGEALFVRHDGHVVQSVKIWQCLKELEIDL